MSHSRKCVWTIERLTCGWHSCYTETYVMPAFKELQNRSKRQNGWLTTHLMTASRQSPPKSAHVRRFARGRRFPTSAAATVYTHNLFNSRRSPSGTQNRKDVRTPPYPYAQTPVTLLFARVRLALFFATLAVDNASDAFVSRHCTSAPTWMDACAYTALRDASVLGSEGSQHPSPPVAATPLPPRRPRVRNAHCANCWTTEATAELRNRSDSHCYGWGGACVDETPPQTHANRQYHCDNNNACFY